MARINLLPWRDELRKEKQKEFFFIAGGSVLLMLDGNAIRPFGVTALPD